MSLSTADCHEGLWVLLTNGWIVGPLLDGAHGNDIFVEFESRPWRVYLPGDDFHPGRHILAVGTRAELLKHPDTNES